MINYLGFGLILKCFWGAVEIEDFLDNVQEPIVSVRKTRRVFFYCVFAVFHTPAGLWFRTKSAFFIVGEFIAFFAHFCVHVCKM